MKAVYTPVIDEWYKVATEKQKHQFDKLFVKPDTSDELFKQGMGTEPMRYVILLFVRLSIYISSQHSYVGIEKDLQKRWMGTTQYRTDFGATTHFKPKAKEGAKTRYLEAAYSFFRQWSFLTR